MSAAVVRPSLNDPTRPRENAGGRRGEVRRARGLEADCSARVHNKRQRNRRERPETERAQRSRKWYNVETSIVLEEYALP